MSVELKDVTYTYSPGTAYEMHALEHVSMEIQDGQFVGVIGHTGSGKSTLVQHFNGLIRPTSGHVYYNGEDIWQEGYNLRELRSHVGLVFQYPEHQLFETDVLTDVCFGPKNQGLSPEECKERAKEALQHVGLDESYYEKSPFELSGGQKRRVAIAGVIAMEPSVLILDEPTAGLDPVGVASILGNIHDYHTARNATIIIVSHSMEEVARTVDRLVVINDGRIPFSGAPREVFAHGDELEAMGLGVPAMTRVFHRLRAMGVDIDPSVYTTEQARDAVLAKLGHAGQQKQSASGERGAV